MAIYKFEDIAINSTAKKKPEESDKQTYIGLEHLDSESLVVERFGSDVAPIGEKLLMKKGDVLFGKRRAYQKKVAIAPFDGIFSAHGMVLRPKEDVIDKDFFPFFISSDCFLDVAIKISVGSLSPTINWGDLKVLEFELPSMEQQAKLAKVLWAAERTKQAYKSLIAKIDDMIKAKFIEMFGDPISNSKKFPTKKMIDIAPSKSYDGNIEPIDGKFWLLNLDMVESNSGNLINKVWVAPKEIGTSTTKFSPRHVLYSKLRPYLNKVYIPDDYGYTTTEMLPLLPDTNIILKEFLAALLRCKPVLNMLKNNVSGTRMPRTNLSVFWNLNVITPPLELQQKFVAIIEQAEQTKKDTQVALDNLNALIKSLINENLTTGEQDV